MGSMENMESENMESESMKSENMGPAPKTGKKRLLIGIGGVFGIIAIVLISVYIYFGVFFQSHFQYRTTINGIDCSKKNVEEVKALIKHQVDGYQLAIEGRDGLKDSISGKEIGLYQEFDGSLEEELQKRGGFSWLSSLFQDTEIELGTLVKYDEALLGKAIDGLAFLESGNQKAPVDACLSEYQKGKGFEVIPEVEGSLVDRKVMEEAIVKSVSLLKDAVALEEVGCYQEPALRSDDGALNALAEKANKYVSTKIVYQFGSEQEILDGDQVAQWITITDQQEIALNAEAVAAFVNEMAIRHDTYGMARTLKTAWGPTVSFASSQYGWKLNQDEERARLMADIPEGKQEEREPIYAVRAQSHDGVDHGGTYVEVNITAQHMYMYKNGARIMESDFISGNETNGLGYYTPSGVFKVTYTQKKAILRGPDYAAPVDFWMPFNGDIGFHDATWKNDFGGNYYLAEGSHGCINMPYDAARTLFNNLKTGDAVFVYRLPGSESAKAIAQDAAKSVDLAIEAIGEVTVDSQAAITAARGSYDALSDQAKGFVKNMDKLLNAEAAYNSLVGQQSEDAKARSEASAVVAAIDGIGDVTWDKAQMVANIRSSYQALSDKAKSYVGNLSVLEAAEARLGL